MNAVGFIARRYLLTKGRSGSMQAIQRVSMIGVAVGAMALVVVLSAFNGLEDLVRSFYDRFDPDLKVLPLEGKRFLLEEGKLEELRMQPGVLAVAPVLEEKVFLRYGESESVAMLKGVDSVFNEVSGVKQNLRVGRFDPSKTEIVMGIGLAYRLGVYLSEAGRPIQVFVPKKGIPRPGEWQNAYRNERLRPGGVFSIQPDFDDVYAFAPLPFVRDLLEAEAYCSSLELAIDGNAKTVKQQLQAVMGDEFRVLDRNEQQETVFKVLKSEGLMTYLILSLTLGIACFTILGAIAISLVEKRRDIFSLWTMGMSKWQIRQLFFRRGMQITLLGGTLGIALGSILVWLQGKYGLIRLGAGYAVDAYPVRLALEDLLLVAFTLATLGGLSSWWAVRKLQISAQN